MATINKNYNKLQKGYLFREISKLTQDFIKRNPKVELLKLGVGDTTEPLTPAVIKGLHNGVKKLAHAKTYIGYQDAEGKESNIRLLTALRDFYQKRNINLETQEIFINDGAKTDLANIQSIFGSDNVVAI